MSDVKKPAWQELKDQEEDLEERARLAEIEEYRKRAMEQWFEDGSCTGGDLRNKNTKE
jgi:hypothetical protein